MGMRKRLPLMLAMAGVMCALGGSRANAAEKKTTSASKTVSGHSTSHSAKSKKRKRSKKVRGQKAIDTTRTRQIQQALIEKHYMQGEPSGKWDDATQNALRKFQADHKWQSKTVPDSRALIELGLGPSTEGLLNPETAMTSGERPATSAKPSEPAPAGKVGPR